MIRHEYDEILDSNELCEICQAYPDPDPFPYLIVDYYLINTHCLELRRNREARNHKNIHPKETVF